MFFMLEWVGIWQNECRAMPQGEGERICRFCKKLLNSPEEIRVPVVAVFNKKKTNREEKRDA